MITLYVSHKDGTVSTTLFESDISDMDMDISEEELGECYIDPVTTAIIAHNIAREIEHDALADSYEVGECPCHRCCLSRDVLSHKQTIDEDAFQLMQRLLDLYLAADNKRGFQETILRGEVSNADELLAHFRGK